MWKRFQIMEDVYRKSQRCVCSVIRMHCFPIRIMKGKIVGNWHRFLWKFEMIGEERLTFGEEGLTFGEENSRNETKKTLANRVKALTICNKGLVNMVMDIRFKALYKYWPLMGIPSTISKVHQDPQRNYDKTTATKLPCDSKLKLWKDERTTFLVKQ